VRRYKSNARFGPWERGDVFESGDALHATLAAEGRLLEGADEPSPGEPVQDGEPHEEG
jgi:hypothetical protein